MVAPPLQQVEKQMIDRSISSKVLSVGPDCKDPKGGIGMVLKTYSTIYGEFRFICTHKEGGVMRKVWVFLVALCRLIPLLCNKGIRIVHVHGASKGSFVRKAIIILLSKLFGKKVVYHVHGGGFKAFTQKHSKIVPFILKKCDMIVALSEYWRSYFADELHCRNVEIVPNIIERPYEDHSVRDGKVCTFLFLGKICKEKGVFDLIELISEHISEFEGKIKLVIAGIGETDKLLSAINHPKLKGIISYVGWVSGTDKVKLLNQCDVYLLPSYFEGVPISLLEAFSYHLPVISTHVGGIPEILADGVNGLMIAPGDQDGLYQAMLKLLSSPKLREQMGKDAYQRSLSHLPENVEKCLTNIYEEMIADGSTNPQ